MGVPTQAKLNKARKELERAKQKKEDLALKKKKVVQAQIAAAQQAVRVARNQTRQEQQRNAELASSLFKQQKQSIDAATTIAIRAGQNAQGIATSRAKAAYSAVNESGLVGAKVQNVMSAIDAAATDALTNSASRQAAQSANDSLTAQPDSVGLSKNVLLLGGLGAGAVIIIAIAKKKKRKK